MTLFIYNSALVMFLMTFNVYCARKGVITPNWFKIISGLSMFPLQYFSFIYGVLHAIN